MRTRAAWRLDHPPQLLGRHHLLQPWSTPLSHSSTGRRRPGSSDDSRSSAEGGAVRLGPFRDRPGLSVYRCRFLVRGGHEAKFQEVRILANAGGSAVGERAHEILSGYDNVKTGT